mgnify:CR=1 FL=1
MITTLTKKRVIRDFHKLDKRFRKNVLKSFPDGINNDSITYLTVNGNLVKAIQYETDDTFYLFRLPSSGLIEPEKKESPIVEEAGAFEPMMDEPEEYSSDYQEFDQEESQDYQD